MTAPAYVEFGGLVHSRPGMSGGQPCVYPTGLTVARVAYLSIQEGLSPEQVIERTCFTGVISVAAIHAALAYYYENQAAIDAEVAESQRQHDELAAAAWPTSLANPEYRRSLDRANGKS